MGTRRDLHRSYNILEWSCCKEGLLGAVKYNTKGQKREGRGQGLGCKNSSGRIPNGWGPEIGSGD